MLQTNSHVKRRVRGAVKTTRKALNRALDAAEPRLEAAVVELQDFGGEAVASLRKGARKGLAQLDGGYGRLAKRMRRGVKGRSFGPGKVALLAAGVAAITLGLLRR
jgi:hypothetical protein